MGTYGSGGTQIGGDSFRISNSADNFPAPETGKCAGMSGYAKWFFERQSSRQGSLFGHFTDDQQRQIARRAQDDVANLLGIRPIALVKSDYDVAEDTISRLDSDNTPQCLFLGKNTFNGFWNWLNVLPNFRTRDAHTVLVVGYQESAGSGTFLIYNNWNTISYTTLGYNAGDLANFSDDNAYVEFRDTPVSTDSLNALFATANYPAP